MKKAPIHIYQIGESQLPLLVPLAIQTFHETFAETNRPEDMEDYNKRCFTIEQFRKEMQSQENWFYFAEIDGAIAGYLKVNIGSAQTEILDEDGFELERIYVLKKYYGSGVGPALMEFAINKGKELGKKYVWLGVYEENYRALRFYEKFGMEEFGDHVFMMGLTPQRDVLMRLGF